MIAATLAALLLVGRFDAQLAAMEAGKFRAAETYTDPALRDLREDPEARARWREILGRNVADSRIRIAAEEEPGSPMLIRGRVVEAGTGNAIPRAVVYLYHTDATGNYAPGQPVGQGSNPRLFGFVRTDGEGRFEVRTIEPAAYPGSEKGFAHVHYRTEAQGFDRAMDQFHPYTHPESEAARAEAIRLVRPANVVHREGGVLVCEVTIPLSTAVGK